LEDELHVYMEVSGEGDYEVKYGNPGLTSGGNWVAVEFKSTLLRVGAPWADCTGSVLDGASYEVGSIMPVLFGGPNTNSIALAAGQPSYDDVIAELSGVSVPVKVVLEVFNAGKTSYTSSAADGQCYKAGNACPENHAVCKAEYCEMDVWAAIIANFKGASPGKVSVLGSVDGSTLTSAYDDLAVDGFYMLPGHEAETQVCVPSGGTCTAWAVSLISSDPLLKSCCFCNANLDVLLAPQVTGSATRLRFQGANNAYLLKDIQLCEKANADPSSNAVITSTCVDVSIGGLSGSSQISIPAHAATYTDWIPTSFAQGASLILKMFHICGPDYYVRYTPDVAGTYSWVNGVANTYHYNVDLMEVQNPVIDGEGPFTVSAIGSPLFDETQLNKATVYVTLSGNDLGIWNPFSWYPSTSPSKWAAIVTDASDTSAISALFDRGYGWVFLTSESGFDTKSSITTSVLDAIEATSTTRRLQTRRLEASEPFWGCDDTLFECAPICMRSHGVVTSKVSKTLCAGAPLDEFKCKCLHSAEWACEGDSVVCKAKFGAGELQTVGDKVCETRGAPKPASTAELRVASKCESVTEMRGSAPTAACLAEWKTTTPEPAEEETPEPAAAETPASMGLLFESFAAPLALAALALNA
jgi:hypothetical protein